MADTPSSPASAPSPTPLPRWLLVLATALLVAWCVPRVKPVLWFGPLFGLLTAALAVGLERWFGRQSSRLWPGVAMLCATVGCTAVFAVTINQARKAEMRLAKDDPNRAAAEALIRSMKQGVDSQSEPITNPSWPSAVERYAEQRYCGTFDPTWSGLIVEVAAAGVVAGILTAIARRFLRRKLEAAA